MPRNDNDLVIEDAQIRWTNFAGREDTYNREGDRNFVVFLSPEDAERLARDGWNIKQTRNNHDDDDFVPQDYMQVKVSYKHTAPRIVTLGEKTRRRTEIGENQVELLDDFEFRTIDLRINPYHWDINGRQGITAYLKNFYGLVVEDFLDLKWAE